jgi:hypothetical protein
MDEPKLTHVEIPTKKLSQRARGGKWAVVSDIEKDIDKVVDFLYTWSYCPLSRPGDGAGRLTGLRDAARQLLELLNKEGSEG